MVSSWLTHEERRETAYHTHSMAFTPGTGSPSESITRWQRYGACCTYYCESNQRLSAKVPPFCQSTQCNWNAAICAETMQNSKKWPVINRGTRLAARPQGPDPRGWGRRKIVFLLRHGTDTRNPGCNAGVPETFMSVLASVHSFRQNHLPR